MVLTPTQEIRVFANGATSFIFSHGRWRLLDIASCFEAWHEAVGPTRPSTLAARIFQAALNLADQRRGALFVVSRDPAGSIPQLVAPEDRMQVAECQEDEPDDSDALSLAQRQMGAPPRGPGPEPTGPRRHRARSHRRHRRSGGDRQPGPAALLWRDLASHGRDRALTRAVQGSRTTASLAASYHGPVLKVSEDGYLAMYLGGRRIWEI